MLNKNHAARLKRVNQRLDRSLDALMQANGELWPTELRPYGVKLQEAVNTLQGLTAEISERLKGSIVPDAQEVEVDPDQEDIEDIEGVQGSGEPTEVEAPTGRRRRSAA